VAVIQKPVDVVKSSPYVVPELAGIPFPLFAPAGLAG